MKPIVSPRELAAAIGVSESSLKRWADEGLVHVSRTAGGHRRITIGEAIRFIREIKAPLLRPDILGLSEIPTPPDSILSADSPADSLFAWLRDGNAREARGLLLSLYFSGWTVADIADGPIRSAMSRLGELWQHDRGGIYIEHRATDICIQAVEQLRLLVEPKEAGLVAVGGGCSGDPYHLPSLLAAVALAADGWHAVNLGPDTPFDAIQCAAERHAPRLIWISVSSVQNAGELRTGIENVAEWCSRHDTTLAVGGKALVELDLPVLPATCVGGSIAEMIRIADECKSPREVRGA